MELDEKLEKLLSGLSHKEKDALHRKLWFPYVCSDVRSHAKIMEKEVTEDDVKAVATRYVYDGAYDCNRSYWDNLETLIEEVTKKDIRTCPVCKKAWDRSEMLYSKDCHGVPLRLVCIDCYNKIMEDGYDGEYYEE